MDDEREQIREVIETLELHYRKQTDLPNAALYPALRFLRQYRNILAGEGRLRCPQGHEYGLHGIDPCDIPF